jgi:hypothetical protein
MSCRCGDSGCRHAVRRAGTRVSAAAVARHEGDGGAGGAVDTVLDGPMGREHYPKSGGVERRGGVLFTPQYYPTLGQKQKTCLKPLWE